MKNNSKEYKRAERKYSKAVRIKKITLKEID